MGLLMGPVLANIIMTELERVIVEPLITSGKIKFKACVCYLLSNFYFFTK